GAARWPTRVGASREDGGWATRARQEAPAFVRERFLDRRLIRRPFIEEMLREHRTRQQEHGTLLWGFLMLELWFRTWIDSDSNRPLDDNENPFAAFAQQAPSSALEVMQSP